jgi:hypothetical protein
VALGVVRAVRVGGAHDPTDAVGQAVGKIIRVLPQPVAEPVEAVVRMSERTPDGHSSAPDPAVTAALVTGCAQRRRLRVAYRLAPGKTRDMDVDPWAGARRILRMDRVTAVEELPESFEAPEGLDPVGAIEEHLSEGWTHKIEVVVDAPIDDVKCWVPRKLARLEAIDEHTTRLLGSTDELDWYAERLAGIAAPFRVVKPDALRERLAVVGRRMLANAEATAG